VEERAGARRGFLNDIGSGGQVSALGSFGLGFMISVVKPAG